MRPKINYFCACLPFLVALLNSQAFAQQECVNGALNDHSDIHIVHRVSDDTERYRFDYLIAQKIKNIEENSGGKCSTLLEDVITRFIDETRARLAQCDAYISDYQITKLQYNSILDTSLEESYCYIGNEAGVVYFLRHEKASGIDENALNLATILGHLDILPELSVGDYYDAISSVDENEYRLSLELNTFAKKRECYKFKYQNFIEALQKLSTDHSISVINFTYNNRIPRGFANENFVTPTQMCSLDINFYIEK